MNITQVTLENSATVLILENVLPLNLLEQAQNFCDTFSVDNPDWEPFGISRFIYQGSHPTYIKLKNYFESELVMQELNVALHDQRLAPSIFKIWVDLPGFGALEPHVEINDAYIAQLFVTRKEHSYTGTTIYNRNKEILFQLPYRNNCGWFFNNGSTVMHGRAHDVPEGVRRFALMVWYSNEPEGDDLSKIRFKTATTT
jgi:hypothetical protein